jgi:hypothetical protein
MHLICIECRKFSSGAGNSFVQVIQRSKKKYSTLQKNLLYSDIEKRAPEPFNVHVVFSTPAHLRIRWGDVWSQVPEIKCVEIDGVGTHQVPENGSGIGSCFEGWQGEIWMKKYPALPIDWRGRKWCLPARYWGSAESAGVLEVRVEA